MPDDTRPLLVVMMDVDPDTEAESNKIYDTEHIPALLRVPDSEAFKRAADSGEWPHRIRPHTRNRRHILYTRVPPGR